MAVPGLVCKEIRHRWLNFLFAVIAVAAAATCLVGALTRLEAHRQSTARILEARRAETQARVEQLEEDVRKNTLKLQFNILILAKTQNVDDFWLNQCADVAMPESYVEVLAKSDLTEINHLEPSLSAKVQWPEMNRSLLLTGVRGEVPLRLVDPKKPFNPPVADGSIVLGSELARLAKASKGSSVTLMGRLFSVQEVHDQRGNIDDVTAWIPLKAAQELMNKPGQINAMKALNCQCSLPDLDLIPGKIAKLLPDAQAIVDKPKAVNRTVALERAQEEGNVALQAEKEHRAKIGAELESSAALVVPLVSITSALWLVILTLANVRARREEIGVLSAIGVRAGTILSLMVSRAVLVGLLGGIIGYVAGFTAAWQWSGRSEHLTIDMRELFTPMALAMALIGGPALAIVSSWLPALAASRRDPADILRADA